MHGKTCLVTGATQGVGRAVAEGLAAQGAHVVLLARDAARGEGVASAIRQRGGSAEVLVADLRLQAQVRQAAAGFQARHDRLHVLVNNAMVLPWTRRVTQDGVEESLAVNHLAHFLLTDLLRAELRRAAPARVVTVTTTAYAKKLDLEDLQMKKRYTPFAAYARTKLLNVLFTVELARRLEGTGVTANAVHPANMVRSGGGREFQGFVKHLMKALGPFHAAPEKAAREPLRVATDPALEGVSGKLFAGGGERRLAPIAQDSQAAKLVWEESERLVAAQRIRAVLA